MSFRSISHEISFPVYIEMVRKRERFDGSGGGGTKPINGPGPGGMDRKIKILDIYA